MNNDTTSVDVSRDRRAGTNPTFLARHRADILCLLVLVAFALGICWPVLTGRVPAAMDTLHLWGPQAMTTQGHVHNTVIADSALQYVPAQIFVRRSLAGGEWPLWNPDLFGGYPFLGTDENQLYYPIAWLLLLLPLSGALQVGAVLHVFLAGVGMYILARVLGRSYVASLLAGLAFAGSGQLYTSIELVGVSSIYVWLPYVVVAAELALKRRSWPWAAVGALLLGIMSVSGHLPWLLYGEVFLAIWLATHLLVDLVPSRREESASGEGNESCTPRGRLRSFAGQAARSVSILVLGPALGMVHILPFLQLVGLSSRISMSGFVPSLNPSIDLGRLISDHLYIVVPRFNGTPLNGGIGLAVTFNNAWYVGLVAMSLAVAALALRLEWRVWLLWGIALCSFGVAFNLPLFNFVNQLPGLRQQIPERIAYLFIVSMALLAAYGYDAALDAVRSRPRAWAAVCSILLVSGAVVALALVVNRASPSTNATLRLLQNGALLQSAVIGALVLLLFVALFATRAQRLRRVGAVVPTLLVLLSVVDLLTYFPDYNTYVSPEDLSPKSVAADIMLSNKGLWRMMPVDNPRPAFPPNTAAYYGLHDVQGYDSLHLKRLDDYWAAVQGGEDGSASDYFGVNYRPQNFRSNQARLLNVQYVVPYAPFRAIRQLSTDVDLGELAGNSMAQSFDAPGRITSLDFAFDARGGQITSPIVLQVRRHFTDTQSLVTESIDPSGWRGVTWATFSFAPLDVYKAEPVVAVLGTPETRPGRSVHVLGSTVDHIGRVRLRLYSNGKWQDRSMAFVASADPGSDLKRIYDRDVAVYTNTLVLPRVFTVSSYEVRSADEIPTVLASPRFNPRQTLLLEATPPPGFGGASSGDGPQSPHDSQAPGTAVMTSYRNLSVEIKADMQRSGWLVLCDVNYPGWTAEVDGQPAALYTAYYLLRAVPLQAGQHIVRFVFRPGSVSLGGAISVAALLAVLSVLLIAAVERTRKARH